MLEFNDRWAAGPACEPKQRAETVEPERLPTERQITIIALPGQTAPTGSAAPDDQTPLLLLHLEYGPGQTVTAHQRGSTIGREHLLPGRRQIHTKYPCDDSVGESDRI